MGIIAKLLGGGDRDVETVEKSEGVNHVSHVEEEPVHDWFSEEAYKVNEDLGVHSDSSAEYGEALGEMSDTSFDVLEAAEMSVDQETRDLVREGYRVVEVDNGEESVTAAYLANNDNVGEMLGEVLWQATYRDENGDLTVDDFAVERGVDMVYSEIEDINNELREEGVDVIGGRRNSTVRASSLASRYDDRSCMNHSTKIGWEDPGISAHVGFDLKRIDSDDLKVGSKDRQGKISEEAERELDFYNQRAYDQEETVKDAAEQLREVFNGQEEVEVTVEQKHRTERIDRIMMDDTQVYDGETFTYEPQDDFKRSNRYDTGLREFDRITSIVERDKVEEYQEA